MVMKDLIRSAFERNPTFCELKTKKNRKHLHMLLLLWCLYCTVIPRADRAYLQNNQDIVRPIRVGVCLCVLKTVRSVRCPKRTYQRDRDLKA